MEKCRVLCILGDLNRCNGITSFIMNYFKYIDNGKVQIDFVVTNNDIDPEYDKIIKEKGNNIYYVSYDKTKSFFHNMNVVNKFMKENASNYDILHSNLINKGYFYLKYAKKYGIKRRILHCHNMTLGNGNFIKRIVNVILKNLAVNNANEYFACSNEAGKYLFGKRDFKVINNAFDVKRFKYDELIRKSVRENMSLTNNVVMIQVGRLDYQKNPQFSLKLVEKLKEDIPNIKLLFVGSGEYEDELKQNVINQNLSNYVEFLGTRGDVNELYDAADIFILPSRFEGLGIVAVEAQISGLPCYLSDAVPRAVLINDNTKFIRQNDVDGWANIIKTSYEIGGRKDYVNESIEHGYYIENEVKNLEKEYLK